MKGLSRLEIFILLLIVGQVVYAQRGSKGELVGVAASLEIPNFQSKQVPKEARPYVNNMIYIPAGSFVMGQELDTITWNSVPTRTYSLSSFFISETEVPNWLYREFCQHMIDSLGSEKAQQFLPDSLCWLNGTTNSDVDYLAAHYFTHPAFDNYPVVGVSYIQAHSFCAWLTSKVKNELRRSKKIASWADFIEFRLPTEEEWEYAARGGSDLHSYYPWGPYYYTFSDDGFVPHANCGAIIDTLGATDLPADHDGYTYTGPIKSYTSNSYGLYNVSGNVSEWTTTIYNPSAYLPVYDLNPAIYDTNAIEDSVRRVIKGGSFDDFPYFLGSSVRRGVMAHTQSKSIGFRVVLQNYGGRENSNYELK